MVGRQAHVLKSAGVRREGGRGESDPVVETALQYSAECEWRLRPGKTVLKVAETRMLIERGG